VKLMYAVAFALFPLAAPAQTMDSSLLSALCYDDYFEDASGQCGSTIQAFLEKHGVVVTRDTDDGLALVFLANPEEERALGSIRIESPAAEQAILTDDDCIDDEPAGGRNIIAYQITTPGPQLEKVAEDADDVATTGPAAKLHPAVAPVSVDDDPTNE
jgi:hypothetical protein